MKLSLVSILAWRYLQTAWQTRASSSMIRIAFLSIALGAGALSLATAIMSGFQKATYKALQGIHPQIIMEVPHSFPSDISNYEHSITELATLGSIAAWSPNWYAHALVQGSDNQLESLIILHGIMPITHAKTTALASTILVPPHTELPTLVHEHHVLIGSSLATNHHLTIGDDITLLYVPTQDNPQKQKKNTQHNSISFDRLELQVSGIIKTGIEEVDATFIICDSKLFEELWPEKTPTTIGITLQAGASTHTIIQQIKATTACPAYGWEALYPSLVAALKLESFVIFFVLSLISLMASMSVGSLLCMIINQKYIDIALLYSLGASSAQMTTLFFLLGTILTATATAAGVLGALLIGLILTFWFPIPLPDAYYVTHVPLDLNPFIFIGVFFFVVGISGLIIWWASRSIQNLSISETLRFDR